MRTLFAIVVLAAAGFASAQTYSMKTFAGGAFPENILATSASLGAVTGIAVDRNGAIFVSLSDYRRVLRIDPVRGTLAPAAVDGLTGPAGLALDGANRLYIADPGSFRVRMVANGVASDAAGNGAQGYGGDGGAALAARFDTPFAVAVDSAGALYVADFYNHVVRKVAGDIVTTVAGTGEFGAGADNVAATSTPLAGPSGIAFDPAGNLYIAELYGNRIRRIVGGTISTVPATAGGTVLKQPTDIAFDSSGVLYIADYGNNRVRVVGPTGTMTVAAGNGTLNSSGDNGAAASAGLAAPRRIAIDPAGNLLIADGVRVRKVVKGVISTLAGGGVPAGENGPAEAAQLLNPQGLTVDPSGSLYLSDPGTGRVLKIAGGTLTRVAGTGNPGTAPETGPAATTPLAFPSGLAVDPAGAVYVADAGAARVRRIANGATATVAGGGTTFGDNGPATKAQLTAPDGLALGAGGALYLSDGHRVRVVAEGVIGPFAGNGSVGYQGEGTLATAARFSSPGGLAVDFAGNLLIADTGNNRVRMVSNGIVTTVPGAAALNSPIAVAADAAGDVYVTEPNRVLKISKGKVSALAGLEGPQGIAVDAAGNVYVADPVNHRVVVLNPAGASCAVTVTLLVPAPTFPTAGVPFRASIQTGAACPWTVDPLPNWISLSGPAYGVGPAMLELTVAPNTDVPRSVTFTIGGQPVTINQGGISTLSGIVTFNGKPLAGVTVSVTGRVTATLTTDAGGNYVLTNLPSDGVYLVTPSHVGYNFVPPATSLGVLTATPTANFAAWIRPRVVAFTPAAYAPGQIVTIYGADLCGPAAAANPTLPDRLAACIVRVDATAVRLYYASPTQINAVLPQTLTVGPHQLTVQRYTTTGYSQLAAASEPLPFTIDRIAVSVLSAAHSGDLLTLFVTGLGRKAQTFSEGAAPARASASVETVRVTVDGQPSTVLYSGVQPQYPGLDQINVRLPKAVRPSLVEIAAPATGHVVRWTLPPL
jgi:uncharacterized protein (TIGR03437 family)